MYGCPARQLVFSEPFDSMNSPVHLSSLVDTLGPTLAIGSILPLRPGLLGPLLFWAEV